MFGFASDCVRCFDAVVVVFVVVGCLTPVGLLSEDVVFVVVAVGVAICWVVWVVVMK